MPFHPSQLHVFVARSNPIGWQIPHKNYLKFAEGMLEAGVTLHVIECAYGDEDWHCQLPGVDHIGVRAKTRAWNKECLLNIGIQRVPEADYIGWFDADIIFRRGDWPIATIRALQHYDVIQPWSTAYDLGPNGEHFQMHHSFLWQWFNRKPVVAEGEKFWAFNGGPYHYPHPGFAWACRRHTLDWVGGLFELGGMGSGDHHMALGLIGEAERSMPHGADANYREAVLRWQQRALYHINYNLGVVGGTIEHLFHGRKTDRGYQSRWGMFLEHQFDPLVDMKRNTWGVLEFASNKPELRHDWDLYLQSRNEDINSL
jgi:hypothetical protein